MQFEYIQDVSTKTLSKHSLVLNSFSGVVFVWDSAEIIFTA